MVTRFNNTVFCVEMGSEAEKTGLFVVILAMILLFSVGEQRIVEMPTELLEWHNTIR